MAKAAKQVNYITKSTVLKRGWSESMVAKLLGDHDKDAPNPHSKSGPPMKLYDEARVLRKEKTKAFQAASAKLATHATTRKAGAKKALETKAVQTAALVERTVITVKVIESEQLIGLARAHQRSRQAERESRRMVRGDFGGSRRFDFDDEFVPTPADREADEEDFERRITINYIRHQLTEYDASCRQLISKIGREEAYRLLRSKVFAAITAAYPWLAEECEKQVAYSR